MRPFHIAISLLRTPKLFLTLFFLPLLLGLVIIFVQGFVTLLMLEAVNHQKRPAAESKRDFNIVRRLLYGDAKPRPEIKVCRWQIVTRADGQKIEVPPVDCNPDRLDVAIHADPNSFDSREFEELFRDNIDRLHVCRICKPDAVIRKVGDEWRTDVSSVFGLLVVRLARFNPRRQSQVSEIVEGAKRDEYLLGDIYLSSVGFEAPTRISDMQYAFALLFNVAGLVIVALWLALKSHRRILDYFARNGALLPMVAATGQGIFYRALWLLTAFRVSAFFLASLPVLFVLLWDVFSGKSEIIFSKGGTISILLWIIALAVSFALATIIASIADLKQRHSVLSFSYTYLPIFIGLLGGLIWGLCFLFETQSAHIVRSLVLAIPVFGMVPLIVAPVFEPNRLVLILHASLALILIARIVRRNSLWFSAHLEEL